MDRFFTESLKTNNVAFDSAVHIARVECPTVILHALDDHIVPIFQPRKVFNEKNIVIKNVKQYCVTSNLRQFLHAALQSRTGI